MSARIAIIGMSAQIVAVVSVGIALGLFIWRSTDRLDRRMVALAGDFSGLRGEVSMLHGEVSELRGAFSVLSREVSELKGEVAELRGDLSALSREVSELRGEFHGRFGAEPAAERP